MGHYIKEQVKKHRIWFVLFCLTLCAAVALATAVGVVATTKQSEQVLFLSYAEGDNLRQYELFPNEYNEVSARYQIPGGIQSFQMVPVGGGFQFAITLGEETTLVNPNSDLGFPTWTKWGLKLIDYEKSSGCAYLPHFDTLLQKEGVGSVIKYGAISKEKKTLVVAEQVFSELGIDPQLAVGKTLSFALQTNENWKLGAHAELDDDFDPNNVATKQNLHRYTASDLKVFCDYVVTGVINKAYFEQFAKLESGAESTMQTNATESYFWLSSESLTLAYDGDHLPFVQKSEQTTWFTYNTFDLNALSRAVVDAGEVFLPVFNFCALTAYNRSDVSVQRATGELVPFVQTTLPTLAKTGDLLEDISQLMFNRNQIGVLEPASMRTTLLSDGLAENWRLYERLLKATIVLAVAVGVFLVVFVVGFVSAKKRGRN